MSDWRDKHSVNCIRCGDLFDERDGYTPDDGEGTLCESCHKELEVLKCQKKKKSSSKTA